MQELSVGSVLQSGVSEGALVLAPPAVQVVSQAPQDAAGFPQDSRPESVAPGPTCSMRDLRVCSIRECVQSRRVCSMRDNTDHVVSGQAATRSDEPKGSDQVWGAASL